MEYKWTVNKLTVGEDNLVVKVDFAVTGTNGSNTASTNYVRDLTRGDLFTPYDQLTEQQVLDWCLAPKVFQWVEEDVGPQSLTRLIKDEGEAQVKSQIESQLAQQAAEPVLPWI
jgi:hypothetical protein